MADISQQISQTQKAISQQQGSISEAETRAQKSRAEQLSIRRQIELQKAGKFREFQLAGGLAGEKERAAKKRRELFAQADVGRKQLSKLRKQKADLIEARDFVTIQVVERGRTVSKRVSRDAYNKARLQLQRELQSKKGTIITPNLDPSDYEAAQVLRALKKSGGQRLQIQLQEARDLRGKVTKTDSGEFIKSGALYSGFGGNVEEFSAISRISQKQRDKIPVTQFKGTPILSEEALFTIKQKAIGGDIQAKSIVKGLEQSRAKTVRPIKSKEQILSEWEDVRPKWRIKLEEFKEKVGEQTQKIGSFIDKQSIINFSPNKAIPSSYIPQSSFIPTIGETKEAIGKGLSWTIDTASEGYDIYYKKLVKDPSKVYIPTFGGTGSIAIDLKEQKKKAKDIYFKTEEEISSKISEDFDKRGSELFLTEYAPTEDRGIVRERKTGERFSFPVARERFSETEAYKELSKQYGKEFRKETKFGEQLKLDLSKAYATYAPEKGGELFFKGTVALGAGVIATKTIPTLGKIYTSLPSSAQTVYEGGIFTSGLLTATDPYASKTTRAVSGTFGTLAGISLVGKGVKLGTSLYSKSFGLKTGWVQEPTKNIKAVRKRATVIVQDKKGRVLYIKDPISGKQILVGGGYKGKGIKAARKGAVKELFEETGIRARPTKLKYLGSDVTFGVMPQKEKVFRLTLDKIPQLKPTTKPGEIGGYIWRQPKKFKLPGKSWFGGKKTQIGADWIVSKYSGLLPGKYSKGFPTLQVLPAEGISRAGGKFWLAKRIPQSSLKNLFNLKYKSLGLIKGKKYKPGQFLKWQKETPIIVGGSSRYEVSAKLAREFETYGKPQLKITGSPTKLKPKFRESLKIYKGDVGIDLKLAERGYKVKKEAIGLFQQPPITPGGKGYLGSDYLGIRRRSIFKFKKIPKESKWSWNPFSQPTIIRDVDKLKLTSKALRGVELEAYRKAGETLKISRFGGKWVQLKGAGVRVKDVIKGATVKDTWGIKGVGSKIKDAILTKKYSYDSPSGESPYGFAAVFYKKPKEEEKKLKTRYNVPLFKEPPKIRERIIRTRELPKIQERNIRIKEPPKIQEIRKPMIERPIPEKRKPPEIIEPTTTIPKIPLTKIPLITKREKPKRKKEKGFRVFGKRRGKLFEITRTPVTRREALSLGTRFGTQTLGRTFKIKKTPFQVTKRNGQRVSRRDLSQFRKFKIRKGKKLFEEGLFIQKARFSLGTKGEKSEILGARQRKEKGLNKLFA